MTDLTPANVAFLMRQALKCKSEDIRFMTVPCSNQFLNELSYAVIDIDDWMAMLNDYINPLTESLKYGNVNIIFKNYFGYGCTAGWFADPAFFAMMNMNTPAPENKPEAPETPGEPEIPNAPDTPDIPDTPAEPEQPQEPVVPEIPAEPEVPQQPENPPE